MKSIVSKSAIFLSVIYIFCGAAQAQSDNAPIAAATAAPKTSETSFNRTDKPFGLYLGVIDPWESLVSLNAAYNVAECLRLVGGVGGVGNASGNNITGDFGLKALLPHESFSPTIGLDIANDFETLGNGNEDWLFVYTDLGFDYQARDGFNLGFGVGVSLFSLNNTLPTTFTSFVVPNLKIGVFF